VEEGEGRSWIQVFFSATLYYCYRFDGFAAPLEVLKLPVHVLPAITRTSERKELVSSKKRVRAQRKARERRRDRETYCRCSFIPSGKIGFPSSPLTYRNGIITLSWSSKTMSGLSTKSMEERVLPCCTQRAVTPRAVSCDEKR
jgi:hypothetical protein